MRPSPFSEVESQLGAVFGEVEGWEVPLRFGGGGDLLAQARRGAGLVPLVPWARLKVTGADRIDLLQRLSTNDLSALAPGRSTPTLFANAKGRIVDRVHLFDRGETLLMIGSPAGRRRIPAWIESFTFSEDVQVTDLTSETAAFAVCGPAAGTLVREATGVDAKFASDRPHTSPTPPTPPTPPPTTTTTTTGQEGRPGRFLDLPIDGVETLVAAWDELPSAWIFVAEMPGIRAVHARVLGAGRALGLVPLGLEEAEVLRVEAGIPADGHELTEEWNPWEIRLEGSFSLTKGCYTGQEVIARLATYDKVQRRLAAVRIDSDRVPLLPAKVYGRHEDGVEKEVGTLTSAVLSDRTGDVAGLAVVRVAWEEPGTALAIGEERLPAAVTPLARS